MVSTDSGLRVEFLDDRIYSVPSAHNQLDWTPLGGYPYLGYLMRFGNCTIYHAGDCVPYPGLADRLRPYSVTVALLPISGRKTDSMPGNFEIAEAAELAEEIGARWLVPMHYGMFASNTGNVSRFIDHLLGQRPSQRFKVFECGEMWKVPRD
jgi:L-ascorbate metabolism protein UlaG (beta-lactamase superfamily)